MTHKQELMAKMAEAQKEYATLATELKEIKRLEDIETRAKNFSEFKYKVHWSGEPDDRVLELLPEDFEFATWSRFGLPVLIYQTPAGQDAFILLRTPEELPRLKELVKRIDAVRNLDRTAEGKKDYEVDSRLREKAFDLQKVIMGEADVSKDSTNES